jgi:hypothetical protein
MNSKLLMWPPCIRILRSLLAISILGCDAGGSSACEEAIGNAVEDAPVSDNRISPATAAKMRSCSHQYKAELVQQCADDKWSVEATSCFRADTALKKAIRVGTHGQDCWRFLSPVQLKHKRILSERIIRPCVNGMLENIRRGK